MICLTQPCKERWWVLAAVMVVMLMPPLDGSALNVAIASIQTAFNAPLSLAAWAPLVYLQVIAALILPIGRLGDLFGFRRLFLLGIVVFTVGSALCGFAPDLGLLIAARVVQGIGACLLMALSTGIVTAVFPPTERGRALGLAGMGIAIGLVLGPTLGGILINWQNWRWIFFINLPIGVLGGLFCLRMIPPIPPSVRHRIDWRGALLAMLMLGSLMLGITQGHDWGWASALTITMFALAVASGIAFFLAEHHNPEPMLELRLFHHRVFAGANIASMMNYLGQFCAIFLTPLLLQRGYGLSPEQAGLMMGVLPVAVMVLAPVSGALSDRLGTRMLAVAGEVLVALGLVFLGLTLHIGSPMILIPSLLLVGVGTGLFQAPNNSAIMGSLPREYLGIGGGVLATMRSLGMSFGIAISTAVFAIGEHAYLRLHPGMDVPALFSGARFGFFAGAAFVLLGALASAVRQDQPSDSKK